MEFKFYHNRQFILKISMLFSLVLADLGAIAQDAGIVFNNNVNLVMRDQVKLVIHNPDSNAIREINGGGMIISEDEFNEVQWYISDSTGTYTIPFGTTPLVQGGTGTKIPLTLLIDTMGTSANGYFSFSTFESQGDSNLIRPAEVANMFSAPDVDNSLNTIDRFWIMDAKNYNTKPAAIINITYDDNVNETGGANTFTESELTAQRWDTIIDAWNSELYGSVNTTTNQVANVRVSSLSFSKVWTLSSATSPLPFTDLRFAANCYDGKVQLRWEEDLQVQEYDQLIIESSRDGNQWEPLAEMDKSRSTFIIDDDTLEYFRLVLLKGEDVLVISNVLKQSCKTQEDERIDAVVYPNPAHGLVNIKISNTMDENSVLTLYNNLGQLLLQEEIMNNPTVRLNLESGSYYAKIRSGDKVITRKFVVVK